MDVIESLKCKTEENENRIESSEETDGNDDGDDHSTAISEANAENSEITGVGDDGVQSPLNKSKSKSSRKHREAVDGESSKGAGGSIEGNDSPSSPLHMQSDEDFQ